MPTFNFEFEELPLVIEGSYEAGLITGFATVAYSYLDARDWVIVDSALEGYQGTPPRRKPVYLGPNSPIHSMIRHRLESEWQEKVQRAVDDQITEDREAEVDNAADYRRDRYQVSEY